MALASFNIYQGSSGICAEGFKKLSTTRHKLLMLAYLIAVK
jgi:hypothetical protein